MPKATGTTPEIETARLVTAYAREQIAECGEDDAPAAILTAIHEAIDAAEICHLGRALIARGEGLADPPYRLGGDRCDPRLTEMAERLGYT